MPLGGKIRVATQRGCGALPPGAPERDWVLLVVTDNGVGIDEDVIARVFDPFFTTKGAAGSGLGLASVQGIVSALDGHVDLTSIPGKGTTVTIALPSVAPPPSIAPPSPRPAAHTSSDRRVILVDDDDDVRETTARILRDAGFEVVEASNAYEGLAAMALGTPAVLVTDVVMPGGMNGLDLADVARRDFPDVGVVLLSAYADSLVGNGPPLPHRLLQKPVSVEVLLEAITDG
jgi:CheY-like chemotaxis protein